MQNVRMSANPFCSIALEEAVKLKESNFIKEITALTIGPIKFFLFLILADLIEQQT